jgi:hypothetical protein
MPKITPISSSKLRKIFEKDEDLARNTGIYHKK